MEFINLGCQVCLTNYGRVGHLKNHMNSTHHRQKMADIFHKETFKSCAVGIRQNRGSRHNRNTGSRCYHHPRGPARGEGTTAPSKKPRFFPQIMMVNPQARRDIKQPIVGLSLMTLCFSQDTETYFYLCHVCEEKCPPDRIAAHLSSIDHFRNYFSYANPNILSFSWIPIMDKKVSLRPEVLREIKAQGPGKLQVLDLPEYLLKKLKPGTYSEAMRTLSENDKLLKLLEVVKPKRTMIQTYQRDSNRKHPLLGMQHLVECICVGLTTKRYYLCTLCRLTLATHMIIKHVLSFDHIYCYFKEWHPSTLLSKGSYRKYDYYFASTMLDFAKQAEEAELQRTANADMKQVSLEPAKFTSVNFASYAEALKELESIRKENKEGSLITVVKPGNRLQPHTVSAAPVVPAGPTAAPAASAVAAAPAASSMLAGPTAPAASVSPAAPAVSSAAAAPAALAVSSAPAGPTAVPAAPAAAAAAAASGKPVAPAGPTAPAASVSPAASSAPARPTAVPAVPAAAAPGKPVVSAGPTDPAGPAVPAGPTALPYKLHCQNCSMGFENINEYCKHLSSRTHKQMLQKHFDGGVDDYKTEGKLSLDLYGYHQESLKQNQPLIGVPLVVTCVSSQVREDPVYVCFACEDCFPESSLKQHFDSIKHLINTLLHQNPWRLPFAWEKQLDVKVLRSMAWEEEKERGPKQMLLKVLDIPSWKFKKLNGLNYPNVMARLQQYHTILRRDVPPSERRSKLQQNERFPLLGANFVVMFNVTRDQHTDMGFLCLLCKRRLTGDECYGHVFSRDHVETFLSCFHPGSLKSSTDAETLLDLAKQATGFHLISDVQIIKLDRPIWEPCSYDKATRILGTAKQKVGKIKLKPPITPKMKLVPRETWKKDKDHVSKAHCVESGENAEKAGNKETPTPSDKESKKRTEVILKTSSEEIQNAGRETCQAINEEKIEEPTARKPTDGSDGAEVGKETSKSTVDAQKQLIRKRKISQEDTCPAENVTQEMDHKRQRLTSKDDTPCEEPQNLPSSTQNVSESVVVTASTSVNQQPGAQLWQYLCRESRDPVIGLNALLECNCDECDPIYLCECCSLKISEKDIISHVTGVYHQRMYLETERVSQKLSPPPRMQQGDSIKHLAALFEQENGYGEAQAVDLDDEIYNNISKQDFESAIQMVKALQIQQDSGHEPPSTSAPPDVQPEDTLVTLHPQHLVCSGTDDYQVVNMQIEDDPEDSKAQPSSVTTAAPATAEATSDTTRVPHESNKDDAMTHIKVSESADNVNTCITVCRSSENKVETISNTNVGPLKTATTSKSVTVTATSDSTVTTTSMTASSKFIAKSSSSTPDTTKSTAPSSRHTAATSSCTTANTKLRETAYKSTAATSICATTACKFTATSSSSSTTISSTATKSATVSKTLENRTGAAAKVPVTSYKTATTPKSESTVVHEAVCRTASKVENASKNSENASTTSVASQTMVTSAATAKMSVKCENTEASVKTAHTKDSVGSPADVAPNARKSSPPAAPHLTARSENKNQNTQPSHTSASNTKPSQNLPRVGFNQLIAVTCKGRQQVYCQLCSVRLKRSSHTGNYFHVSNYLRMQYPGWNPKSHGHIVETATNHLAEVEKDKRFHAIQRLEMEIDEYRELAQLSEDEAVGRLKEMLTQRDLQCSSPSTADTAVALRQQFPSASPCEVSSPDDGMYMQQNKGLCTDNQSEQENRRELQTHLVQISEIESTSEKTEIPAVDQSDRAQSMKSSEPEADDLISDQPHFFSILNKNEPVANPSAEDTGTAAVKVDKPQGHDVRPLATDSADRPSQTPDACQETTEKRQQQESRDPRLRSGRWRVLEGSEKTSLVNFLNLDLPSSVAAVTTEQQNHPKPSQKQTKPVSEQSQALPMIPIGESIEGSSNLFEHFLTVKGYDRESVIGLGSVWECRGISLSPFYLCESCVETLSIGNICQHMVSKKHQLNYVRRLNPQFLSFMDCDLPEPHKERILNGVAERVALQERYNDCDAQVIMLRPELHESVRKAPFNEALVIVQRIKKAKKLIVPWQSICTPEQKDQQPEAQQSPEESLPMETQPEPPPETNQRSGMCMQQNKGLSTDNQSEQENRHELQTHLVQISEIESTSEKTETPAVDQSDRAQSMKSSEPEADDLISDQPHSFSILDKNEPVANPSAEDTGTAGVRQKNEEPHLEEMVENLDDQRRVQSPPHVTSVSSKADSVVSPILDAGKCPQDQPEPTVPILQHQRPMPELQVRQAEVHSESLSYSVISPQTSQILSESPGDKCLPTRKRKADESCTNHPQLEDPFPAKRTCSVLQPVSQPSPESAAESTSINPAATSTLMSLKDGDAEQDTPVVDMTMIAELVALVRERKSEVHASPHKLAPDNGDTETSCANNSSESGVERVWDPNSAQTTVAQKTTRWDLKWELVKVTNNPPPSSVSEEMFSTAASVVLGHENQLVTPNASSVFSASSSSLEGSTSTRGDLLFRATDAKAFSTMLPSASTVDPTNPQQQRSDNAQSIFGHQSNRIPIHCTVTNDNPCQIPQPRDYTETDSTGVPQLPINTIVTSRPKPPKQQFMVDYNVQDNSEVNRGNQVTHSFSTGSPGDASGGYGQYSQMACVTTGQSGYFFSEAAASYPTPNNPPAYTWSSYQFEGQTTRGLHLSQMYPQQQANHFSVQSFGHSAAPPQVPEWVRLGMQQRALIFQEQYSSWPSASLSAGVGTVTNEAACVGAVPFMIPPNTSQMMDLSQYSTSGIAPTLNSNNMITQNTPQGELHPAVIYHLPAANTEVIFQPSANPYVASGTGFLP